MLFHNGLLRARWITMSLLRWSAQVLVTRRSHCNQGAGDKQRQPSRGELGKLRLTRMKKHLAKNWAALHA